MKALNTDPPFLVPLPPQDVNVEMNYWMTGPSNLLETFHPFTHWIDSIRPVRINATVAAFGRRGWIMRGESGLFGGSTWDWVCHI